MFLKNTQKNALFSLLHFIMSSKLEYTVIHTSHHRLFKQALLTLPKLLHRNAILLYKRSQFKLIYSSRLFFQHNEIIEPHIPTSNLSVNHTHTVYYIPHSNMNTTIVRTQRHMYRYFQYNCNEQTIYASPHLRSPNHNRTQSSFSAERAGYGDPTFIVFAAQRLSWNFKRRSLFTYRLF